RLQVFGNVDLTGSALGVAHREVIVGTVLFPLHASTSRLSALGKPLNQRGAQDGTEPAKLPDELAPPSVEWTQSSAQSAVPSADQSRICTLSARERPWPPRRSESTTPPWRPSPPPGAYSTPALSPTVEQLTCPHRGQPCAAFRDSRTVDQSAAEMGISPAT